MQDIQHKPVRENEEDLFKGLLKKYMPYWPLYLFIVLISLAAAYLYGKWTIPVYEAYSSVVIKDESKGLDESKMLEDLNLFRGKKIVDNEIEILKSHSFMRAVVNNLGLYADVFEQTKSREIPAYSFTPIRLRLKNPDAITKPVKISFSYDREKKEVVLGKSSYPINQWVNTKWGELIFITNYQYKGTGENKNLFFSLVSPDIIEAGLLNSLKVVPASRLATVINLKIKDEVPQRAIDILDELVGVYTKAEIEDKNLRAANTVAMVENRLKNVSGQLDSVENAIQQFRTSSDIIDISEQGRQYLQNVGQYDRQIEDIKNQIAILNEVDRFVSSKSENAGTVPSAVGINDPGLNKLLGDLNDYQSQYEKLKRTTGENSPIIISLKEQIDRLKPSIIENVRNQKNNLEISKSSFTSSSSRFSGMLNSIPKKEKQLTEISRQQSIKNQLYGYLLEKREEAALSFTSTRIGDTRVIDKAFASVAPVSPNKLLLYLAALIFGAAAGLVYVSLKEELNSKILFRKEIEHAVDAPVIGEIFQLRSKEKIVSKKAPGDQVYEQIKALKNNLFYTAREHPLKSVMITSATRNEGKSFIALNLALSLAKSNQSVLLLDLDFRNKKITSQFELSDKPGIADALNSGAAVSSIVYSTTDDKNLFIVPAGRNAEEFDALLMGEEFAQLVAALKAQYDVLIFSGSSFRDDANIQSLSHIADTSLFVIRHGVSTKAGFNMLQLNASIESLKNANMVFNGVKGRGWGINMFGNGYGFGNNPKV
jgi:tyrosine-protein kinase Etk/Wzc